MTVEFMMPFYGSFALLRTAVESVLAQDDDDWVLTVLDDAYPDPAPGKWVQSLGEKRIRYVRNKENLGVSGNFRKCADLASESLICMIGCDDVALPGYVRRMKALASSHPEAAYFQPGVVVISEDGSEVLPLADRVKRFYAPSRRPSVLTGADLACSLSRACWTYFPSICWRLETLRSFPFHAHLDVALDLDVQLRIADAGGSLVVDDTVTFHYRRHRASVSSWKADDGSRFAEERSVLDAAAVRAHAKGWSGARRAARLRISSRLSAITRLPAAVRARHGRGIAALVRHALR